MRGSIGGSTWSRNKGGMYVRQRAVPTNPNSVRQQAVRAIVATLSQGWATLSAAFQEEWRTYAQEHPVLNSLGQTIYLTGMDWFVKINSRLIDAGAASISEPPIGGGPGSLATIDATFASGTTISIAFTPTPATGNRLVTWCSLPQNLGTSPNFRQCRLAGYSALAPASPVVVTMPFTYQIGNRVVVYVSQMDATGLMGGYLRDVATRTI
jgi:hypothetical protein